MDMRKLDPREAVKNSVKKSYAKAPPKLRRVIATVLVVAVLLVVGISFMRWDSVRREERERKAELAAGPRVRVATVKQSPGEHILRLIGETRPYQEATLYAKVSGYLKSILVDKGDVVRKGQVLATIESPETDQAYAGALADARNKRAIAGRIRTLFAEQLVSPQERDQAQADADVASARLTSEAVLKGYETIRAPFDGTVTARFADPGALVQNATTSRSSALPVVTVSQIKRLRVDVFVDQREANFVAKDQPVVITSNDAAGLRLEGQVSRISDELDPKTKMLLTEIDIPNDKRQLVAGSFVQVEIKVKSPPYAVVPVGALVLRGGKTFLTVVTPSNQVSFKPVEIADNDGKNLRILSGIKPGERVALNVGDTIPEGGKVRPVAEAGNGVGDTHP